MKNTNIQLTHEIGPNIRGSLATSTFVSLNSPIDLLGTYIGVMIEGASRFLSAGKINPLDAEQVEMLQRVQAQLESE